MPKLDFQNADRKALVEQVERNLQVISRRYHVGLDAFWLMDHLQAVPNPHPHLLESYKSRFGIDIREPTYFILDARRNAGLYCMFTNSLALEVWLNAEGKEIVHSHEMGHALQYQHNTKMVKGIWERVNGRRTRNPEIRGLVTNLKSISGLLQSSQTEEERDYLRRLNFATGSMIALFSYQYNPSTQELTCPEETLEEGFAEWASNKVLGKPNPDRDSQLQVFKRLEEIVGEGETLRIALAVADDKELTTSVQRYIPDFAGFAPKPL